MKLGMGLHVMVFMSFLAVGADLVGVHHHAEVDSQDEFGHVASHNGANCYQIECSVPFLLISHLIVTPAAWAQICACFARACFGFVVSSCA